MGGKSKSSGTQTVTEKADPWSGQQGYLTDVFRQAQDNYYNQTPEYYPNQTFVDFAPQSLQGLQQTQDLADQNLIGYSAANEAFNTLNGMYLNNNPYMDQMTDRIGRDVANQVNSQFGASNRMGSNAHAETLAQSVADATAPVYADMYNRERENMQRASALAPQSDMMQYAGADRLRQVGAALEGKEYEALQDDVNRWNFAQSLPDQELANYAGLVSGNFGGSSLSQTQLPQSGGNFVTGALGGASTGAGIAQALGYSAGPWAIGGSILGGLFS